MLFLQITVRSFILYNIYNFTLTIGERNANYKTRTVHPISTSSRYLNNPKIQNIERSDDMPYSTRIYKDFTLKRQLNIHTTINSYTDDANTTKLRKYSYILHKNIANNNNINPFIESAQK